MIPIVLAGFALKSVDQLMEQLCSASFLFPLGRWASGVKVEMQEEMQKDSQCPMVKA